MKRTVSAFVFSALGFAALAGAQEPNPTQTPRPASGDAVPIFRVTVVSRTTKAINFHHRTGTTMVDLKGTELMPQATGTVKVQSNTGATKMTVDARKLSAPQSFGPEYLTFVAWAITPEGRADNLGEIVLNGDATHRSIDVATELQAFGIIVTAEPYWGVTQPSDVVVMENFIRQDTTGTIEQVDAKYELLQRGQYTKVVSPGVLTPLIGDTKTNLQLREARNAVEISRATGSDRYAGETFNKALIDLKNAEDYNRGKGDKKAIETNAREAVQMAEDARIITLRKLREENLAAERSASAQREADARAQAEAEARSRAQADADRAAADRARMDAERARADAERAKADALAASDQANKDRAAAEAARQAALAQQVAAQADAEKSRLAASQANSALEKSEAEKAELRQRLLAQLNAILETKESARGLIVNISDVLFDFGKATLKPGTREKLAKLSGILLAYPGLRLQLEGHTDSIGSDEFNQTLSEKRAFAVRDYLTSSGINGNSLTAVGYGKASPVASNDTDAGRQQNRRVDMVVSGEIIGDFSGFGHQTITGGCKNRTADGTVSAVR